MKATAQAPANIAFIKYWGRRDDALRLPANSSISMNLSACYTTTTVEFSEKLSEDTVVGADAKRVREHLDRIRSLAKRNEFAHVATENNFPSSAGIASSASGFAALTVAATAALGLTLSENEVSRLARLGSGSACRSIPDGFVKWEGEGAYSLYSPDHWDLRDIIVIVAGQKKKISSSAGHAAARTSPFFASRLSAIPGRIKRVEEALKTKNIRLLGETIEEECLDMHHVMQTQTPPLYYWTEDTKRVIAAIKKSGLPACFTIDAGPNVHIICEAEAETRVMKLLAGYRTIVNKPARGAHIV